MTAPARGRPGGPSASRDCNSPARVRIAAGAKTRPRRHLARERPLARHRSARSAQRIQHRANQTPWRAAEQRTLGTGRADQRSASSLGFGAAKRWLRAAGRHASTFAMVASGAGEWIGQADEIAIKNQSVCDFAPAAVAAMSTPGDRPWSRPAVAGDWVNARVTAGHAVVDRSRQ